MVKLYLEIDKRVLQWDPKVKSIVTNCGISRETSELCLNVILSETGETYTNIEHVKLLIPLFLKGVGMANLCSSLYIA